MIHSHSSQEIFLKVPCLHQQIQFSKYSLGICSISAMAPGDAEPSGIRSRMTHRLVPLSAAGVAGSEILRQALGSEVIRVFATPAPFLGFLGRLQAFQTMVPDSKIISVEETLEVLPAGADYLSSPDTPRAPLLGLEVSASIEVSV